MIPRILSIAGSDSGGGAGIQADIKAITLNGGHAMTAITAITAQNTLGVTAVEPVPVAMILAQIDAVLSDIGVDAVKIGMIGSAAAAHAVADRLEALTGVPIVFDPVMIATSGAALADADTIAAFARLMAVATVVTPNAPELTALTGLAIDDVAGLAAAGEALRARTGAAILAKGGHLPGGRLTDLLIERGGEVHRWTDTKIETRHTHGTGCTLASALATGLGAGLSLVEAAARARAYVRAGLLAAPGLGAGHGPLGNPAIVLN
ncbi:bifunctional hydroxymethylpyrimidine kinase/phosphomethylpyrimidine kinase [Sphingomonas naphthae]|uniref:hydroxymethylpyrimidine kinase n=1 Tax=Sphingomonas naphthae TaxID=1813468 RepID=A0ABY7TM54_9SPHN|nr:bifunctional hydroxymethylpyrimidine kinase/phosphomethylpyrimidine kinase [Sphingomonas naphthae]WCT74113.1 bifunctional hydroxymethylpyrimidine kinase/phosphomethylpyrimidine kinase [Sphingomonas naphthae]